MPEKDGLAVLEELDEVTIEKKPYVVVMSAIGQERITHKAISLGAMYYVVKPFEPKEVIARVNAHIRRQNTDDTSNDNQSEGLAKFDNISIDIEKYEVKLNDKIVSGLKPKEVQLMYFLLTNKNQVFSRETLLEKVWGYEYFGGTRTVDVHIKSIREKLFSENQKWEIKTIWNVGYKLETLD